MFQYYAASSLDGFIADAEDGIGFLDAMPQPEPSTYEAFIADVGAIVMGSATYEFVQRHVAGGGEWPYSQPTWVLTSRTLPAIEGADVRFVAGDVAALRDDLLAAAGDKNVWLAGGGDLVGQFHDAGMLDELWIQVASCTLGSGKPVLPRNIALRLEKVNPMGEGFVELRYSLA